MKNGLLAKYVGNGNGDVEWNSAAFCVLWRYAVKWFRLQRYGKSLDMQ
ncbi:hypothetical protein HMPREF9445_02577 [Bacteroides clarus YIT 12056]|uniref:Uncharacterized protein n=1 Tax=Bacteroides clarus YIT 12056 TaxID=762984 RepID=A0ABP2KSF1_9BACE|nr:hypothetical protein HMPREF9445_02577 [Bacteroides clarus YIT 12056]